MFKNSLWESPVHTSKRIIYILGGITLASVIAMLVVMFIAELYALIPAGIMVILLAVLLIVGKNSRWMNEKLVFAVDNEGLYYTSQFGDGSYFYADYTNIASFTAVRRGKYHTVTVHFKRPENAGVNGDLKSLKMIKIERYAELSEILSAHGIKNGK